MVFCFKKVEPVFCTGILLLLCNAVLPQKCEGDACVEHSAQGHEFDSQEQHSLYKDSLRMTGNSSTFSLHSDLEKIPMPERHFIDFESFLYDSDVVRLRQGQVLVLTDPEEIGGRTVRSRFSNGFVGTLYQAYNEHRHLILRPDDVWIAITTAFSLYINSGDNAEAMRKHFVDFEGKIKLTVEDFGSIRSTDWEGIIDKMSDLIDTNTKNEVRKWMEPDFSTTTPVGKTVGKMVLMGAMQNYFEYEVILLCGLPSVTLEGIEADWVKLRQKAAHLASFNIDSLSHWAGLLDYILGKMLDSYRGNVDKEFWSHITTKESWESGPSYIEGWINVFMPFTENGEYRLLDANPEQWDWGAIDSDHIPPSTVEVPVHIIDNGVEHDTIFYAGHIVTLYDEKVNSVRPSLDWCMVDVTGSEGPLRIDYRYIFDEEDEEEGEFKVPQRIKDYKPQSFPKATRYLYNNLI